MKETRPHGLCGGKYPGRRPRCSAELALTDIERGRCSQLLLLVVFFWPAGINPVGCSVGGYIIIVVVVVVVVIIIIP